jgi:hypothetical protein
VSPGLAARPEQNDERRKSQRSSAKVFARESFGGSVLSLDVVAAVEVDQAGWPTLLEDARHNWRTFLKLWPTYLTSSALVVLIVAGNVSTRASPLGMSEPRLFASGCAMSLLVWYLLFHAVLLRVSGASWRVAALSCTGFIIIGSVTIAVFALSDAPPLSLVPVTGLAFLVSCVTVGPNTFLSTDTFRNKAMLTVAMGLVAFAAVSMIIAYSYVCLVGVVSDFWIGTVVCGIVYPLACTLLGRVFIADFLSFGYLGAGRSANTAGGPPSESRVRLYISIMARTTLMMSGYIIMCSIESLLAFTIALASSTGMGLLLAYLSSKAIHSNWLDRLLEWAPGCGVGAVGTVATGRRESAAAVAAAASDDLEGGDASTTILQVWNAQRRKHAIERASLLFFAEAVAEKLMSVTTGVFVIAQHVAAGSAATDSLQGIALRAVLLVLVELAEDVLKKRAILLGGGVIISHHEIRPGFYACACASSIIVMSLNAFYTAIAIVDWEAALAAGANSTNRTSSSISVP